MTPSAEVNRLALQQLQATFGRSRLFRAMSQVDSHEEKSASMPGRVLFRDDVTIDWLNQQIRRGGKVRVSLVVVSDGGQGPVGSNAAPDATNHGARAQWAPLLVNLSAHQQDSLPRRVTDSACQSAHSLGQQGLDGGPCRIRTCDFDSVKIALYQLS